MEEKSSSNKLLCIIRILNLSSAYYHAYLRGVLIGFGIAGIIYMSLQNLVSGKFFLIFSPIFMIIFGLLILAAEFKVKVILETLTFFQSLIGRGIFNIYLSSQVFFYFACGSNEAVVGWIMAIILFCMGFLYFILQCCGGEEYSESVKLETE